MRFVEGQRAVIATHEPDLGSYDRRRQFDRDRTFGVGDYCYAATRGAVRIQRAPYFVISGRTQLLRSITECFCGRVRSGEEREVAEALDAVDTRRHLVVYEATTTAEVVRTVSLQVMRRATCTVQKQQQKKGALGHKRPDVEVRDGRSAKREGNLQASFAGSLLTAGLGGCADEKWQTQKVGAGDTATEQREKPVQGLIMGFIV